MDSQRWQAVERLFFEIVDLPSSEQKTKLDQIKSDDPEIYNEVLALLKEEQALHPLLRTDATHSWQGWQDMELIGQTVGIYRLTELLGSGGMGSVFLAERSDGSFEQTVALKLIQEGVYSLSTIQNFVNERQILARLTHPYIAKLLDGGVYDQNRPFYTMEHVKGEPIDDYCENKKASLSDRITLFIQICEAVQYAHSQLTLHLDLKPSNILVDESGRVRLLDFGIAKLLDRGTKTADSQPISERRYTLAFASPEQLRGDELSTASDIYSLGVILYFLLTGKHPFEEDMSERENMRSSIISKPAPLPGDTIEQLVYDWPVKASAVRGDLDLIVDRILEKKATDRYTSVSSIIEDLKAFQSNQPISLRKDKPAYVFRKFVDRNKSLVSLLGIGLITVFTTVFYYTNQLNQEKKTARQEADKSQQMVNLLTGMFTQANPNVSLGEELTAKDLLNQGTDRFKEELKNQPELQADMFETLGAIYLDLAEYDHADTLLRLCVQLRDSLYEPSNEKRLFAYYGLARLFQEQGKFDSAYQTFESSLELAKQTSKPNKPFISELYYTLGEMQGAKGDYEKSDSLLEIALDYIKGTKDDSSTAVIYLSRGINARKLHQFDSANYYYQQSLDIRRELYPEVHPEVAHSLNHFASLYLDMEDYETALPFAQQSLDIRKEVFGEKHPETIASWANVSRILTRLEQYEEALGNYEKVYQLLGEIYGKSHPYLAGIRGSIATVYLRMDRYEESEANYLKAREILLEVLPAGHIQFANNLVSLGTVNLKMERYSQAKQYYEEALQQQQKTLPEDHPDIAKVKVELGKVYQKMGDLEKARSEWEDARKIYQNDKETYSAKLEEITSILNDL